MGARRRPRAAGCYGLYTYIHTHTVVTYRRRPTELFFLYCLIRSLLCFG